jgi:hypothetical protein
MLRCRDAPIHRALRWGITQLGTQPGALRRAPGSMERENCAGHHRLAYEGSAGGARRETTCEGVVSPARSPCTDCGGVVALAAGSLAAEETAFGEHRPEGRWYSAPAGPANDKAGAWEKESIPLGNGFLGASILRRRSTATSSSINDHTTGPGPGRTPPTTADFSAKERRSDERGPNHEGPGTSIQAAWDGHARHRRRERQHHPGHDPSSAKMSEITTSVKPDRRQHGRLGSTGSSARSS